MPWPQSLIARCSIEATTSLAPISPCVERLIEARALIDFAVLTDRIKSFRPAPAQAYRAPPLFQERTEIMDAKTSGSPLNDPGKESAAMRSLLGRTNRDWWPNQLSLDILHQHGLHGNPMGDDFD